MCPFLFAPMRERCLQLVLIFLVASAGVSAQAQESKLSLTLDEVVKKTLNNNPELQLYATRLLGVAGLQESANLAPALELAVEIENVAGSGNFSGVDQAETTVALSSFIELGNKKRARVAVTNAKHTQLKMQQQLEALALLAEVTRRYITVLAAQERLAIADESSQIAENTLRSIEQRSQAGASMRTDVLRAQAENVKALRKREAIATQLTIAKSQLALLWGQTAIDFDGVTGDLFDVGDLVDLDDFQSVILNNPIVQVYATELGVRQAQLELSRSQSSPDIQWQLGARQFQETSDTALVLGLNIPLFSGKRSSGNVKAAQADLLEVQQRRDIALLELQSTLFSLTQQQQQAIAQANELRDTVIPLLEESVVEAADAYDRGRYRYTDWINAQRDLVHAQENLIASAKQALTLRASIEQYTAGPLSGLTENNE